MTTFPYILLGGGWQCDYLELDPKLYEFMEPQVVPSLFVWSFDKRRPEGWVAWLTRAFDLPPMDDLCWNFVLTIKALPSDVELHLNGRNLGVLQTPFELDVSDMVALDDNRIAFRVLPTSVGSFGDVRMRAVLCE
ncbi:MAG: hypothetical protein SGI73_02630 [Chloroflexota bacterium]|nr:hypothetical protein [Chloroflexota bacterium]